MSQNSNQTSAISNGANVHLTGLQKVELNGTKGICKGLDHQSGRYKVQLVGSATSMYPKPILIKRENLQVMPPDAPIHFYAHDPVTSENRPGMPENSAWANGLSSLAAAEWFVDCYRMRVDDDAVLAGNMHGLYSLPDDSTAAAEVTFDFLKFCLLATENRVIPAHFDWNICINQYGKSLRYAFEKADAREKYGRENFFSAMLGGRSLRYTATIVYGIGVEYDSAPEPGYEEVIGKVDFRVAPLLASITAGTEFLVGAIDCLPVVFETVGGSVLWKELLQKLAVEFEKP